NNNAEENVIAPLLDEVISFARSHFDTEDGLMDKYEYPGSFEHKEEHQSLLNDVVRLKKKFLEGGEWVVLQELKDWFLLHITNLDKPLATFLVKHGVE
ncbi:MAG TPA: hemerythrin domain-containing protein, partial [Nitrososphaerales archaeon]|nr:hemerythrin domain-containing protein [Nitrososphaerales archaeon]